MSRIVPMLGMTACLLGGTLMSFTASAQDEAADPVLALAEAPFVNTKGESIGTAVFTEGPAGVVISLALEGLSAGDHAIHIHSAGDCSPIGELQEGEGYFTNTGGHFNPDEHNHGILSEGGAHAGDLPNLTVSVDGTAKTDMFNDRITLIENADNGRAYLFDEDGAAMILHEGTDDYISQPTGAAGGRVACAVIGKK